MSENIVAAVEQPSESLPRALKIAVGAGLAFCAWLIFGFDPLPIVDLPQHAAQLALYRALGDSSFPYAGQYEINYFTPYLLAYLIAGGFALALPIATAFKAAIYVALAAFIFAIHRFQRRVGGDPWWILLGFPLFFGLSFVWGFLNFLMALSLVLLALELSYAFGASPRWRTGLPVALAGIGLFFAHGMACVFGMAVGGAVAVARSGSWQSSRTLLPALPRLLAPYLPAAALTLLWRLVNRGMSLDTTWFLLRERLSVHRRLLGDHMDVEAMFWSLPLLAAVVFAVVASRHIWRDLSPAERWARRLPLFAIAGYTVLMPDQLGTLFHANGRFLLFLPLFAGWWLGRRAWRLVPILFVALSFGWLLILGGRFAVVERELQPLLQLLDQLPPRGKLLSFRLDQDKNAFEVPFVMHQAAWYSAKKEGQVDFSFAAFPTQLVRYVPGRQPAIPQGFEHKPWKYDIFTLAGDYYDYWLIYAPPGAVADLSPERFRLRDRKGQWMLYEAVRTP